MFLTRSEYGLSFAMDGRTRRALSLMTCCMQIGVSIPSPLKDGCFKVCTQNVSPSSYARLIILVFDNSRVCNRSHQGKALALSTFHLLPLRRSSLFTSSAPQPSASAPQKASSSASKSGSSPLSSNPPPSKRSWRSTRTLDAR